MSTGQIAFHNDRISRVCEYISHNLDEELTLDILSNVAAFSKFHFHRVFSAHTGVSLTKFIQLARLRRASLQVAFRHDLRIIDIALDAGFDSPEAFSRAFKRTFGLAPSQFRANPEWPSWHSSFQFNLPSDGEKNMKVEIVNFEEEKVAVIEHKGPAERVLDTATKFIAWRKETGLSPVSTSRTFGVPYSDPKQTPPEEFRFDFCGTVQDEVPENAFGVKTGVIPGGRCAVVRHKGSHDNLEDSIYYLYRDWLPGSGEELRDSPCFFDYLNLIYEVDECDLLTDIYLPIK